jgi:lipopolysaccharide/colanic/teichoic acid biosynthesis glycosyltransferase
MRAASYVVDRPPAYLTSARYRVIKRGLDIVGAIFALILAAPLYPLVALAVKLTSAGPIFYRWNVVGEGGRLFVGYKVRTMVANADAIRATLDAHNERRGPAFKMRNDPRITRVGRFLRRFSIDELPQLVSVLSGDMSFIGPRPLQVHEWRQCTEYQKQRNNVRPGAVSLWHVSGQPPTFDEWVELDLEYIARWSLRLDLMIFLRSIGYVLRAKNQ